MHARLAHRVVQQAKIQAYKHPLKDGRFRGGLVLDDGDWQLRHRRYNKPTEVYDTGAAYPERMEGAFNYGGPVHKRFGQYMSEMVHRIVPSRLLNPGAPFICVAVSGRRGIASYETLPSFAREVLDLLDVGASDFRLVRQNTIVEQLFVAEQGAEFGIGPKPGYLDDLREYVSPRLDARHRWETRPGKVYVSRSRMRGGVFLGERYLEAQLAAEGFTILHPQLLPISVQMDHYRKADVLVFAEGSACHGVELLGTGSLGRTCLLVRRERLRSVFERILRPRASDFAASTGHSFLGTRFLRSGREPNTTVGVIVFDVKKLLAFFRANDIARLPGFNERDYLAAAESDLTRYLGGGLSVTSEVLRRLLRRLVGSASADRKIGLAATLTARRELKDAFRRHKTTKLAPP